MSIVLRANQLNTIIYKYLLEAGLTHTAYTFFNQASLAQSLQEFKYDLKAGHLLSLLEKSLIYSQIEAHVCMNEYMECSQPFYLLKSHTCKIVEKARKQKQQIIKQLENQLNDSIKRTNSIYNTAVQNKNYQEITYEAKGSKYFDKFAKIKFPASQSHQNQYILKGQFQKPILYIPNYEIDILRYDSLNQQVTIEKIVSCIKGGNLEQPITFAYLSESIIQIYSDNYITFISLKDHEFIDPVEFKIEANSQINNIQVNLNIPELVGLNSDDQYWILNLTNMTILEQGFGRLVWRDYDEFLVVRREEIKLKEISTGTQIISFPTDILWRQIKFNAGKTLFVAISNLSKIMHVYTFDQQIPLFIFDEENSKDLLQVLWVSSNGVDYICWLTNDKIKVYDISLNGYAKIIELQKYGTSIKRLCCMRKSDKDECFLIGLGRDNVIILDLSNSQIERIQVNFQIKDICTINGGLLGMLTDSCIYFLVPEYIEKLFM